MPSTYPNLPPEVVNPNHEPTGAYTGRCGVCGSDDLWDDNLSYGCNNCGAFWGPDDSLDPVLVRDE